MREIVEEVREIVKRKMEMLERWGFRFESDDPFTWKLCGSEAMRIVLSEKDITVYYIYYHGEYLAKVSTSFQSPKWRQELEITLRIAIEDFVASFLKSKLGDYYRDGRYVVMFRLLEHKWELFVSDIRRGNIVFSERKSLRESPLKAFESALRATAVANL